MQWEYFKHFKITFLVFYNLSIFKWQEDFKVVLGLQVLNAFPSGIATES